VNGQPVPVAASTLRGLGVSGGRAAGPVARLVRGTDEAPPDRRVDDPDHQLVRLEKACTAVAAQLRERSEAATTDEGRDVLEAGAMMAEDPGLHAAAVARVTDLGQSAERAVWEAAGGYADKLRAIGGYLGARADDVLDVRTRVVAHLQGTAVPGMPERDHPFVLVADDLAPADTAGLDPTLVVGVVTREGGPTGHTAIIARSLGIPTVVACRGCDDLVDGELVVVDGIEGTVARGADHDVVAQVERERARRASGPGVARLPDGPVQTLDGTVVSLLANVGDEAGARRAVELGATGSGLFRTELLFLERTDPPGRAEQAEAYAAVLGHLSGRVVVRTLDAGADKPLPFLTFDEPNPALGVRGLRAMLEREDLLLTQLEAVVEAREATGAEVWTMAPMVTTVEEADWFRERCHGVGLDRVGVMIEVPAAALLAGPLLDVVDFVSIGTNDLTQYTMAADRVLGAVAGLNDPWQPAVLRLVAMTAAEGTARARPAGVCGEAAADPALAAVLVGLGVRSLSATPTALPAVAEVLQGLTLQACEAAAAAALAATSPDRARAAAAQALHGQEVTRAGTA
jgi:phosphoenolpyruvate-protein phosphotransferase